MNQMLEFLPGLLIFLVLTGGAFLFLVASRPGGKRASNPFVVLEEENAVRSKVALTTAEFIRIRHQLKVDLEAELVEAADAEKAQLAARIAELESQIANPDAALAEANKRIAELEALLEREGNEIASDRIAEAHAALEAGDFSIANDIFAEIEARADLEVEKAARAAFGRGEVAEEQVRWADAARHYGRAARLNPTYDTLLKASRFAERAGAYDTALQYSGDLVAFARKTEIPENLATALNQRAINLRAQGRYVEAETLYREALEIDRATIGEGHPDYAARLNNLAAVLQAQGRYAESETLTRQAMEVDRATLGEAHPEYAVGLNNLGLVVQAQGRLEEAERLYRQALEIDRATIGEAHPDYATRLNDLGSVVQDQGRLEEAETLFRQALEITRATLGEAHPAYAIHLNNLGNVVQDQGRLEEAETLYTEALSILEVTLPADHPHIETVQKKLAALRAAKD